MSAWRGSIVVVWAKGRSVDQAVDQARGDPGGALVAIELRVEFGDVSQAQLAAGLGASAA